MSNRVFKVQPMFPFSEQQAISKACDTLAHVGCAMPECEHLPASDARDWEHPLAQIAWANYVVPYYHPPVCYPCFLRLSPEEQNYMLASRWLYVSGVSSKEMGARFDNFQLSETNTDFHSLVMRWSANPKWSFLALLSPQKGVGKTRLAVSAMADHFITHAGVSRVNESGMIIPTVFDGYMIFVQEGDIALRIRDTFGNDERGLTEKDITDELYNAEFLIVDDLFSIKATDFNRQIVLNVLEHRMNSENKRTVFTSNYALDDLRKVDERLFSRLSDGEKGMVININNTTMVDYRQRRKEVHTL